MDWITFPALDLPGIKHGFSLRDPAIPREELDAQLRPSMAEQRFPVELVIEGEQTHGNGVAVITGFDWPGKRIFLSDVSGKPVEGSQPVQFTPAGRIPGVDALVTDFDLMPLVIRVADCGAVYFYDPVKRVIALAHSGRKGTEANITEQTIRAMQATYGSRPEDIIVQLGPCIRPPHYEVAFAEEIGRQARATGVVQYHDCQLCTACDLERFYSYRAELGKTGRMWAVLMLEEVD